MFNQARSLLLILILLCFHGLTGISADTVQISFLSTHNLLRQTTSTLISIGMKPEVVSAFDMAVRDYNLNGSPPPIENARHDSQGTYHFASMDALLQALTNKLSETAHPFSLNCFDGVILLTADLFACPAKVKAPSGPYLVPRTKVNSPPISVAASIQDAFSMLYPDDYIRESRMAMTIVDEDLRKALTVAFFSSYALPLTIEAGEISDTVMQTLRTKWDRMGVRFPKALSIVLCHNVQFSSRYFVTSHAGLLVELSKDHYMYIEKAGGRGPFVRLDLRTTTDLESWLAGKFSESEELGYDYNYVTFNNNSLRRLSMNKKP